MNLQEYELIKGYTSYELDAWSLQKYGPVLYDYQDNRGKRPGLHRHHIGENERPNLSSWENQQKYPEEQKAHRLRYYDLLEHCYRHLVDAEECIINKTSPTGSLLGIGGYYKLRQSLLDNPTSEIIELVQQFDNRVKQIPIVFEYNQQAFQQAFEYLETKGKALIVIGTGLGKTPSGLEAMRVLIQENVHRKTLVLADKNDILDSSWSGYDDFIDVATYQSLLTNDHLEEDAKKYELIICDEAHHMNNNEWSAKVALLCQYNPSIKLLGLTATPETAQDKNDLDLTTCQAFFGGNVCIGMSLLQAIEKDIVWPFKYTIGIFKERVLLESLGLTNDDIQKYNLDLDNLTWVNLLTKHMPKTPRKGLIFASRISDIDSIITSWKQLFPSYDIRPYHSKQNNEEHQAIKDWFDKTDQGFLVSVDQLSEGYHPHGINTLIMLRSTRSSIVYRQQLGRITQLKRFVQEDPDGIVFDFINNYAHLEDAYEFGRKLKEVEEILKRNKKLKEADELLNLDAINTLEALKLAYQQNNSSWEEWEDEIVRQYYPTEGAIGCLNRLQNEFTNRFGKEKIYPRNRKAITAHACYIGIKTDLSHFTQSVWKLDDNLDILDQFVSIQEANLSCNKPINSKNISVALKAKNKAYGYYWCKPEEYDSFSPTIGKFKRGILFRNDLESELGWKTLAEWQDILSLSDSEKRNIRRQAKLRQEGLSYHRVVGRYWERKN